MSFKPESLPEWMTSPGAKARRAWWPPRSIGRIMALVALSGFAMASYAQRTRPAAPNPRFGPFVTQPPGSSWVQLPRPRDPSVIVAPRGIDDAMIVTSRAEIDEAMIVSPERMKSGSRVVVPWVPLREDPSGTPRSEPRP
jgi:hypothetical protein